MLGTRSFTPARSWAEDDADVAVRVSAAAQALLEAAPPGAEAAAASSALLLWYLRDRKGDTGAPRRGAGGP